MVKQDNDGVVAKIDLSGMESFINILSGRAETVAILDEVMNEFGENPKDWLPIFNEKLSNINSK